MSDVTRVYTDGACLGNPGPGGWAWVVPDGPFASGADPQTTNQRMELTAVLEAVTHLDGPLEVMSDSAYVVNCFRDGWWEGWLKRDWLNSQKKPVANRDLWEPLIEIYQQRPITFRWVKAHAGDEWNDIADRLAVEAAQRQHGRSGDRPPEDLGEADRPPAAAPATAPSLKKIAGHSLLVVGPRPPGLGGYGDTLLAGAVRDRLESIIGAKKILHDDLVVVTGMNLGTETLAAEAARTAGVPYVVVLAHPGQDSPWPAESKRRFSKLLDDAAEIITLQRQTPETKQKLGASYRRRDGWLARNVDEAIAVWDGEDEFLGRVVKSLRDTLGEENVWIIDPAELG